MMKTVNFKNVTALMAILAISAFAKISAQENPKKIQREVNEYLKEAEDAMSENDFASAEASYRKAIAKDPGNTVAKYNMGNLYYNKEKTPQAENRLREANEISASKEDKHRINHNLGNSFMKQKKYKEAVEAYKNALRNDPTDEETRYNLALAKKMLEEQQQNQDQNKDNKDENKDQNKDQDQDKQNQDGEGGDDQQNKDNQPKDEGENKDEQNKDKGEQDENKDQDQNKKDQQDKGDEKGDEQKEQPQQPQPTQGQLSPQQIKSLLEAMNNEEKKVQDKINAEKAKGVKVRSEKDW
ncbi:tetratricopeptide repeat protein [Zunongwangia sp. F363]|uniref:Tetratricopeptide repeat protein n=1 Tax=Autumnicola tepida TaxID=3075595 RepID=A0ABU3C6M7_9FLAO|nr:tetratricopeptide repeat protein [Zunongwangia sp. F363]MDT0641996.1 tetratricopeptide repeat protein [Zunongwangia sp. F363]